MNKENQPDNERIYPCYKCGKLRTKAEGGTTFTLCDECWDKAYPKKTQPVPPVEPDLMLTDVTQFEIARMLADWDGLDEVSDAHWAVFMDNAKDVLAKVQPLLTANEAKIRELEAAIDQFENNDPTGLQAYYLKKAREMKP